MTQDLLCRSCLDTPCHCLGECNEVQLANAFRDFILLEKELDAGKAMLSQKADFNLTDAYEMFDTENEGCITIQKLKHGFHRMELYPSCDETVLFFKRFDSHCKDALTMNDFRKVFLPKDTFFASNLKKRG
jgi:hypothetical protein